MSALRVLLLLVILAFPAPVQAAWPAPETDLLGFLAAQPGVLREYHAGDQRAAAIIDASCAFYAVSPRLVLAALEASAQLLSNPQPPADALETPFGAAYPAGFAAQIDGLVRDLRGGLGPYAAPPMLTFTDGTTYTLTLDQAAEGVAIQRALARGRSQPEWRAVLERFGEAYARYFDNVLPGYEPDGGRFVLRRPWPAGTRVTHLAYFDHAYPTVDSGARDDGAVLNYLGRGGVQYGGHDGHDYVFPDQPIGTFILAAADGLAFASTQRGNGVYIRHDAGYETVYWHLDRFALTFRGNIDTSVGVPVRAGDLIGSSGATGTRGGTPHLHFEVRRAGKQVDPYGWYGAGEDPCPRYAGCAPSRWLWHASLVGEFDFTPPR